MTADDPADTDDLPTPTETKEQLEPAGAWVRAETHLESPLEVLGTVFEGDPKVSLSTPRVGSIDDSAFSLSMSPATARELARALERRADYAERYAEHKRTQADPDGE